MKDRHGGWTTTIAISISESPDLEPPGHEWSPSEAGDGDDGNVPVVFWLSPRLWRRSPSRWIHGAAIRDW